MYRLTRTNLKKRSIPPLPKRYQPWVQNVFLRLCRVNYLLLTKVVIT